MDTAEGGSVMKIKGEITSREVLKKVSKEVRISRHPHLVMLMVTYLIGLVLALWTLIDEYVNYGGPGEPGFPDEPLVVLPLAGFFCVFYVIPLFLLQVNLIALLHMPKSVKWKRVFRTWEWLSIVTSGLFFLMAGGSIAFMADWQETLYNNQLHTPIWTDAYPLIILLGCVAVLGYVILSCIPLRKLPPLVTVLSIAAMYIGVILCIVWDIQIMGGQSLEKSNKIIYFAVTLNLVLIVLKTIRYKMAEWKEQELEKREKEGREEESRKWYAWIVKRLEHAQNWPLAAFLFMLPLLGILIGILILFGQQPDAVIKAWTETSDWQFSTRISPPNVQIDEHYLCTVAAGGHKKIVKPLRMGERHGHRVIVNRQLCIANAFEQILEERTPKFHRLVRNFYDTYGFPVAKLIRSRWAADFVYVLMKPLEWFFLIVIYLCDVKPENRIAVQYLPK